MSQFSRTARFVVQLLASGFSDLVSGTMMCQACHGLDGLSKTPDASDIAGQTEQYLVVQLQAFRSGGRKNDAMSVVAPILSDQDIDDPAAYYSAIEISVGRLPGL